MTSLRIIVTNIVVVVVSKENSRRRRCHRKGRITILKVVVVYSFCGGVPTVLVALLVFAWTYCYCVSGTAVMVVVSMLSS